MQTRLALNHATHLLAEDEDVEDLKRRMEAATASGGRFVDFTSVGGSRVSVLVTPVTEVTLSRQAARSEPESVDDVDFPYSDLFY